MIRQRLMRLLESASVLVRRIRPRPPRPQGEPPDETRAFAVAHQPCRACGSQRMYRSRARSQVEKLLIANSSVQIFRCHVCGWRGWLEPFEPPVPPITPDEAAVDLRALDTAPRVAEPDPVAMLEHDK